MNAHWLTWANLLTALRLASVPTLTLAVVYQDWWIAAVLFSLAALSDFYDGRLARRYDQASPLGGLLDHTTDATLVSCGCYALAQIDIINPYLPWLIAIAFLQYMLDSRALAGRPLRASALGRSNGIAYFAFLGTAIGIYALGLAKILTFLPWLLSALAWLLVMSSLISIGDRLFALLRA